MNKYFIKTKHPRWKYKVVSPALFSVPYPFTRFEFDHEFYSLSDGILTAKRGYSWDGLTCCPDFSDECVHAALAHDMLCQAMYDHGFIPKRLVNESHKVFLMHLGGTQGKFIYHALRGLHKPWHKFSTFTNSIKSKLKTRSSETKSLT